jgi:hypothetical protein
MERIRALFLALAITGPLHMIEQLLFGIEELQEMKRVFGAYYALFADPDIATVTLVTIIGASILFMVYGLIAGPVSRFAVLGIFGILSIGECHHVLRVVVTNGYNPGVLTSIPFTIVGVLLVSAVWRAYQKETREGGLWRRAELALRS